jgi:hypothetical protein
LVAVVGVPTAAVVVYHTVAVNEQLVGVAAADRAVAVGVDAQTATDDSEVVARAEVVVVVTVC